MRVVFKPQRGCPHSREHITECDAGLAQPTHETTPQERTNPHFRLGQLEVVPFGQRLKLALKILRGDVISKANRAELGEVDDHDLIFQQFGNILNATTTAFRTQEGWQGIHHVILTSLLNSTLCLGMLQIAKPFLEIGNQ